MDVKHGSFECNEGYFPVTEKILKNERRISRDTMIGDCNEKFPREGLDEYMEVVRRFGYYVKNNRKW